MNLITTITNKADYNLHLKVWNKLLQVLKLINGRAGIWIYVSLRCEAFPFLIMSLPLWRMGSINAGGQLQLQTLKVVMICLHPTYLFKLFSPSMEICMISVSILSVGNAFPNSLLIQTLYFFFKIQFKVHSSYDSFLDHFLQILVELPLYQTYNNVILLFIYVFYPSH